MRLAGSDRLDRPLARSSMNWRTTGLRVFRTSSGVPANTTLPSYSIAMRSPTLKALHVVRDDDRGDAQPLLHRADQVVDDVAP